MTPILILDGGLGTSLETDHAITFTSAETPLWSSSLLLTSPATLLSCQRDFARVPVDVLLTATYQVSVEGFAATRTPDHPEGVAEDAIPVYLEKAVRIAEDATSSGGSTKGRVALSLGPYGACMIPSQEYSGRYDAEHNGFEALEAWHKRRMAIFAPLKDLPSRISFIALETVPRVDEITAMRRALASNSALSGIPYWVSCLYPGSEEGGDPEADYRLPDGHTVDDAVRAMLDTSTGETPPWAIGINCTKTWKLEALLRRYEDAVAQLVREGVVAAWPALVLYPDGTSGEVYNTVTQAWEKKPESAAPGTESDKPWEERVALAVEGTIERGQWSSVLVGGCCMASHRDIKRLRDRLRPST